MATIDERFKQVKTFIFDVDGVFTNGDVHLLESGEQYRTFDIKDSYAVKKALEAGFRVGIVSSANADGVRKWLDILNVKDIFMGGPDDQKVYAYLGYISRESLREEEILYMGDDLPDYMILSRTEPVSTCPADAVEEIQAVCDYIASKPGGRGAVREVIEQVMKAQKKWTVGLTQQK